MVHARKMCSKCHTVKDISEFTRRPPRSQWDRGYGSECKRCNADRTLAYYHSNPEYRERNRISSAASRVQKTYGISYGEYLEKAIAQESKCAICGRVAKVHLDHCHATGKIRDFLCIHCNRMIGWANDDPEYLMKMARYLERHAEIPQE